MKQLFKSTIVIWSEFDPTTVTLDYLAKQAIDGQAYCSLQDTKKVKDPRRDPDWDGSEFFEE